MWSFSPCSSAVNSVMAEGPSRVTVRSSRSRFGCDTSRLPIGPSAAALSGPLGEALKHGVVRQAALDAVSAVDRSNRTPLTGADLAAFEAAMHDAFNHVNDSTFRTKLADLVATAQGRYGTSLPHSQTGPMP
jgi:hypothetical protein